MNPQIPTPTTDRLAARLSDLGMPRTAVTALLERHTMVQYRRGAELFSTGSPADVIFAVLSGLVKVYSSRGGSDRVLVELAGPGDLVGYADVADGGVRSQLFEARALTNCCVALFTRHHIFEVLKGLEPEAILRLLEATNSIWSLVAHRYTAFLGMSLRKRLEFVLEELARRFGVPDARGVLLTPELAQEELAEMIGSSRPMVGKLLAEMTREGTIVRNGRHLLLASLEPERRHPDDPARKGTSAQTHSGREPSGRLRTAPAQQPDRLIAHAALARGAVTGA
jgi:CRP/FNR family transcriptional regulator, cyclic AMP receptor protein